MIQHVIYDMDDIDRFLEVHETNSDAYSQTLQKLFNVQNKIPIIANIEQKDLEVILENLKFSRYNFKDFIIKEGDLSTEIFFILSGECHVFHNNSKIGILKAGTSFGEAAAIFNKKRNASVVCASDASTLLSFSINHDNMDFCAPSLAQIYKNLASQINTKLEVMNDNLTKK
ncbi:cyclic nucleotide-binding domain-containing protein [Sulfurimonas sp. SAG-AH-194-I05]|nr:cyclic nucleotide-binding domain-containing protein [Sulfurimonas sp. SAG-AH-194-I05]MDF1875349.1 cyclic nucleotide-binding domain-containing protein [Sulfurimonas sp. SAG-AH-194-I05]